MHFFLESIEYSTYNLTLNNGRYPSQYIDLPIDKQQHPVTGTGTSKATQQNSRGRPRDPEVENRVFDAVMRIYSARGWSGYSYEAVARESGVGKSSLYRRWSTREELLSATLKARWLPVEHIDTGTLRGDLRLLAQMIFDNRTGDYAQLEQWFLVDGQQYSEVRTVTKPYIRSTILQARSITRRAAERGELQAAPDAGLVMDLIVGAVNNHVTTTPPHLRKAMMTKSSAYLDQVVDVVLKGTCPGYI